MPETASGAACAWALSGRMCCCASRRPCHPPSRRGALLLFAIDSSGRPRTSRSLPICVRGGALHAPHLVPWQRFPLAPTSERVRGRWAHCGPRELRVRNSTRANRPPFAAASRLVSRTVFSL
ncbi:hypothetical protein OBBRIDRAFT_334585 [Obba rivulosa]|uniref:Uncharacterized protein n=1 Tax=Obba rivulosa TaxID=1052685 RepID=A0A8E2ATS7_9APHY|nr:hypothetical protein OBBRIDRAFT_334585 [Obba rivulosa]